MSEETPVLPAKIRMLIDAPDFPEWDRRKLLDLVRVPGFVEFARKYQDKIAKKLRTAKEPESKGDVVAEVRVAARFLERGCEVKYEPSKGGPDLEVKVGEAVFLCEVKRIRPSESPWKWKDETDNLCEQVGALPCNVIMVIDCREDVGVLLENQEAVVDAVRRGAELFGGDESEVQVEFVSQPLQLFALESSEAGRGRLEVWKSIQFDEEGPGKFVGDVCAKLRQFACGSVNVLYFIVDCEKKMSFDFDTGMDELVSRAEGKDDEFSRQWRKLSAAASEVVWGIGDSPGISWRANPDAAPRVPERVRCLLDEMASGPVARC